MFSSIDTLWVLLGATLVFFMQPGFAMVEAGLTRSKNSGNIVMKNIMDLSMGSIFFWIVGFGIMFGAGNAFFGEFDFFIQGDYSGTYPTWALVIFQTVFCATAATIVSGAMAERTKFATYCVYSVIISAIIYPISGHWIWGGGWLSQLGFHDFAGSTTVHMVGGVAAFVGASVVGPRIGKYSKEGKSNAIPGSNIVITTLGVLVLWFGWFGFNGASTLGLTGDSAVLSASLIFMNTNLAAAFASFTVMVITWIKYGKPDVSMTLNGILAGLVGITAGCDAVSPMSAAIIGIVSGVAVVVGINVIDKVLKIDDPVGAVAVHGVCGAVGTIIVGLLAEDGGLFFGGGFELLGIQILGVLAVIAWVGGTSFVMFKVLKETIGIRVPELEETEGLDISEHNLFTGYDYSYIGASLGTSVSEKVKAVNMEKSENASTGIRKVTVFMNKDKFEKFRGAMSAIGITGMTVTNVMGCGAEKGKSQYYRGVNVDMKLLPKVQVDIVVANIPVETVVETAKAVLGSGMIGDGKIFVEDVENAIRIRTGTEGREALIDEEPA